MLRNLIFDWSGTLVDDLGAVAEATNLIFRHFRQPELLLEEFRERFRLPCAGFYEEHLPGISLPEIEPLFHEHFAARQEMIALLPHALEFLRFCQATHRRIFLLSATHAAHIERQIARLGLSDFFERVYASVFDKRQQIALLLTTHGLHPEETAFIGDMVHDVETARLGAVKSIAVLTGYDSAAKLSRARPDVIVRDLGELQALLETTAHAADEIRIEELEFLARVGVPESERAEPQRLTISLTLQARGSFSSLDDQLSRTIDYAAVCEEIRAFAETRADQLIETLASAIADQLLARFDLARVALELRKFVLPETKFVAVRLTRTR